MKSAHSLRSGAEALTVAMPALLARADHLASAVLLGAHGRRRAGQGTEFWQFRAARDGDPLRRIDWRRSAKGEGHFIREKEWQSAQTILIWADRSQSMGYTGHKSRPPKVDRVRLLALALSLLLLRGDERVGLLGGPVGSGRVRADRLAAELLQTESADYGTPPAVNWPRRARGVFMSDFLGDFAAVEKVVLTAADRGVTGTLVQILDPVETAFPYEGRTIFESMGRRISFETLKARSLRPAYRDRLAARQDALAMLGRRIGWPVHLHLTDTPAQSALLWLYRMLDGRT